MQYQASHAVASITQEQSSPHLKGVLGTPTSTELPLPVAM